MYIVDTNVVYYLGDPDRAPAARIARLEGRAADGHLQLAYTPITAIELVTRIHEDPSAFTQVNRGVKSFMQLKPKHLCNPDQRVQEIIRDFAQPHRTTAMWHRIMTEIERATEPSDVSSVKLKAVSLRKRYEKHHTESMMRYLEAWDPDCHNKLARGKSIRLTKDKQYKLEAFIGSDWWQRRFIEQTAASAGEQLPSDPVRLATIGKKLAYYRNGWELLMVAMAKQGLVPSAKHKNDRNDLYLLLYLTPYDGNILVTSEKRRILGRFAKKFPDKCIDFDAFLDKEAV